jgi:hypothetical protein
MVWLRAAARAARTLRLSHVTRDNRAIKEARIIEAAETAPAGARIRSRLFSMGRKPSTARLRNVAKTERMTQISKPQARVWNGAFGTDIGRSSANPLTFARHSTRDIRS